LKEPNEFKRQQKIRKSEQYDKKKNSFSTEICEHVLKVLNGQMRFLHLIV